MGRTDLARFRKNAPSIVPPVDLPHSVTRLVQAIESHSDVYAAQAVRSLSHASSQRDQVSAIKLLGVALREPRQHKPENPCDLTSSETSGSVTSESVDELIEKLLSIVVFDIPEATPGLISTALRAILRCRRPLHIFECRRRAFFDRLENIQDDGLAADVLFVPHRVDPLLHRGYASDVNAVAAVLSEIESKPWIINYPSRLVGVTHLLSYLTNMHIFMLDNTFPVQNTKSSTGFSPPNNGVQSETALFNVILATSACESSMKVAQDLTTFLTSLPDKSPDINLQLRETLARKIFHSCSLLLMVESIPRSCSLACSVALVTSRMLMGQNCTSKTQLLTALRKDVLSSIPQYPLFSQLSLLRAVLEAPLFKPAIPEILFQSSTFPEVDTSPTSTVFGILAALISESSDLHFRYLATDTLISCIRAVVPLKLDKRCRDAILRLVYLRWEEPFAGTSTQIRETVEALVSVDRQDDDSNRFWLDITANLVNGNWLSKGMYAPLSALVKRVGATEVLRLQPDCQYLAMLAAASDSHLTKAASDWLYKFWTVLNEEYNHLLEAFIQSTASSLLSALLNNDHPSLRERVAEHILPLYLNCDDRKETVERALAILSTLKTAKFTHAQRVRGSVIVASVARKQGVDLGGLSDQTTVDLIREGLSSLEEDLRSFAFDLVVTSGSQTEPIKQVELDLILGYMPIALMPGGSPSDRSKFKHSMRRFFERFAACRRSANEGSSGWWARQRKLKYGGERTKELDCIRVALIERLNTFERRCLEVLMGSSYPGASCVRRTSAFEVMSLMSGIVGINYECMSSKPSRPEAVVASFLSALFDNWERPRRAAYQYVSSLPSFLPGVSPLAEAESLQMYAYNFLDSSRLNYVDSGASLFRVLFQKHVCWYGKGETVRAIENVQDVISFPEKQPRSSDHLEHVCGSYSMHPEFDYCMGIFDSIERRIDLSKKNFRNACDRGLFHGRFLVLRYIFQDFPWGKTRTEFAQSQLDALVQRFTDLCDRCLQIALQGVSFGRFNETVASKERNCDGEDGEDARDSIFLADEAQVETTSCFLSAKEICVALGVFCNQVPLSEFSGVKDFSQAPTCSLFTRAGEFFCYVFTNTRHWGVIDGATEGMQLLCERVLASPSIHLRYLPTTWVSKILSQALDGKLYVLRRSAGIPWLITAAVNAEASVNRKSHDSPLLNCVMGTLLEHLERPEVGCLLKGEDEDCCGGDEEQGKRIESTSHVLNFLRSLFLNSNVAGNMLQYTEKSIMHCINAFYTKYWLIRNSTMMLYSALVRRGIGVCRERKGDETVSSFKAMGGTSGTLDGERRITTTTTYQFFSRHPRLIPFLLSHLRRAIQSSKSMATSSHESLYPTLYFLSCLSPDANKDPTLCLSMSTFWPIVRRCSHWHVEYVRRAAAAATVSLIEDYSAVPSIIRQIMQSGLPSEPLKVSCQRCPPLNQNEKGSPVFRLEQNQLHGDLLSLIAILRNVQGLMTGKDKLRLVDECAELLSERVWISVDKTKNGCSVTRACMFELLSLFHNIAWGVWHERKYNASFEVLCICNRAASKIDLHEICFENSGLEIGAPVLRTKAVRFLGQTLLCQCKMGALTLEAALEKLVMFATGEDKETFVSAVETSARLLQFFINSKPYVEPKRLEELGTLLQQLWMSVAVVIQRRQNAEKVVVALDLMSCILEVCKSYPQCDISFESITTGALFDVTSDACIDVCERALIVCGQWIERSELDRGMLLTWMRAIARACASQTPSLRIAGCTSLFKSGFAFASPEGSPERDEELSVQARIIWLSLLEDDSSEVRKHALELASKYAINESNGEIRVHILPCLMNTFAYMSKHFSTSKVLYNVLTQSLGILPNHSYRDGLLSLIAELVGLNDFETSDLCIHLYTALGDDECPENRQRQLFRLETDCGAGETVLHMQLVAWTYARIMFYGRKCADQTVEDLSVQNTQSAQRITKEITTLGHNELNQLRHTLMQHNEKSQKRVSIYLETLTARGFAETMRHVLRVFLVARCALVCGAAPCIDYICTNLQNIIETSHEYIHPVLSNAMSALANSKEPDKLPQQTLFLLPPESMVLSFRDR